MGRVQRPKRSPTTTSAPSPVDPQLPQVAPPTPPEAKPLYLCSPFVEAALVKGNFKTIVILPKYVDIMEWVAVNSASTTRFSAFVGFFDDHDLYFSQYSIFIPISTRSTASYRSVAPLTTVRRCQLARRTVFCPTLDQLPI